jgi:hypothetical protein
MARVVGNVGLTLYADVRLLGKRPRLWYNVYQLAAWQHIPGPGRVASNEQKVIP